MRKTCLDMVWELAQQDERICFIGSDLGAGTLAAFRKCCPERFFMEGVSEANVVGMAAGLALEGRIVYVNTIATFLTRRCFEQVALDLCLHRLKVRLIGNGGGVVYAPLGPTHEATEDLAILRTLPHMTLIAPADAEEMRRLMPCTVNHPDPIYIRLAKGGDPVVTDPNRPFVIGEIYPYGEGGDAAILSTGVMLGPALEAAKKLREEGCAVRVLHIPTVKPLDPARLLQAIEGVRAVLTVEEHTVIGGLGSAVAEILAESPHRPAFRRLGIPDAFPSHYGSQADHFETFGLTPKGIATAMRELL